MNKQYVPPHFASVCVDVRDPREGNADGREMLGEIPKGRVRKVTSTMSSGKPKYAPFTKSFDLTILVD